MDTTPEQLVLGDVTVTRIEEFYGPVGMTPAQFFPDSGQHAWDEHRAWLAPDFWDPDTDECRTALQSWLLRSEGRTILVDTGVGNHKERPYAPVWSRLDTRYLDRLAAAGVRPEDVDLVVNVLEDSVAPVHRAGLTRLWEDTYRIDRNLRLDAAPGHTPGSSVLTLESAGGQALFVGDLVHTALQIAEPATNSCFCEDPAESRATRHKLLGRAADRHALVFPAHFGGHGAAEVARSGSKFAIKEWAPFSRIS